MEKVKNWLTGIGMIGFVLGLCFLPIIVADYFVSLGYSRDMAGMYAMLVWFLYILVALYLVGRYFPRRELKKDLKESLETGEKVVIGFGHALGCDQYETYHIEGADILDSKGRSCKFNNIFKWMLKNNFTVLYTTV